jgi:hypothetical protein
MMSLSGAGKNGWAIGGHVIKELLPEHERNVTHLSQEGEYRTQNPDERNFSFSIFFL